MQFIGIGGPKELGKSHLSKFLASYVEDTLNKRSQILSFATPVKELAAYPEKYKGTQLIIKVYQFWLHRIYNRVIALTATMHTLYAYNKWPNVPDVKNRRLLQYIGTEIGRELLYEGVWVDDWYQRVDPLVDYVFADDMRFNNEAAEMNTRIEIKGRYSEEHPSEQGITLEYHYKIEPMADDTTLTNLARLVFRR